MDQKSPHKISDRLLSLPVTLEGKVQLWLTYKGLKPVSTAQFLSSRTPQEEVDFSKWLQDAKLVQAPDHKSEEFVFVSKDMDLAKRAAEIMWSENKDDLLEKGDLFGYPQEAVRAYAFQKDVTVITPSNFQEYWSSYVRYLVRTTHINEDRLTAKNWADVIRKDIPKLAIQFEEEMANVIVR